MSEHSKLDLQARRQAMSSLADGDAGAAAATDACALWGSDAEAREAWRTYHLIGDVLRSDDLAVPGGRDEVFLSSLRSRLAAEPTVMAPMPALPAPARKPAWRVPAALAAGVVALAGVLVVARTAAPGAEGSAGPALAAAPVVAPAPPAARDPSLLGDPAWQVVDGKLIRDARLDSYLRAHRSGAPVAMPGGATGRFETVVLER